MAGLLKLPRLFLLLVLLTASAISVQGYSLEPSRWPLGSHLVVQLGFGPTSIPLQDGFASWNASAADALDIWNGYLDFITATSTALPTVPQTSGDGINSAFFSDTVFGDSFDEGPLAVTVVLTQDNDVTHTAEADVLVNNAFV